MSGLPAPFSDQPHYPKTKRSQIWRRSRGYCVVRSSDCPPSRYEAAVAAKFSSLRTLILGTRNRRALPEFAALVILAQRRWNWSLARLGRELGERQWTIFQWRWGILPAIRNGSLPVEPFIRLAAIADLGEVEWVAIWQRCAVPREYAHARSRGHCEGKKFFPRSWPVDQCPAAYQEIYNHFMSEVLIEREYPSWHWKKFFEYMIDACQHVGANPDDMALELRGYCDRLKRYYIDPLKKATELPAMITRYEKLVPDPNFIEEDWDNDNKLRGEDGD